MGKMSKFLAIAQDFSSCPGFPIKSLGKGQQSTPGGCNNFVTFLVRRENAWHMNTAVHRFVLRDLVLIELFQISHNCVTECMLQAKCLLKPIYKLLEISFFSNMWNFPICCSFIQQKGKVETFRFAGRPPVLISLAQWDILISPWSAYYNYFLSKQKNYSM